MLFFTSKIRQNFEILPNVCNFAADFDFAMCKRDIILDYAALHPRFTIEDLSSALGGQWSATKRAMAWQVSELVKAGSLTRVSNGLFAVSRKQNYTPVLSQQAKAVGRYLHEQFPLLTFCLYESSHISPLLHHLAYTNTVFVETLRQGAEIVFHSLSDKYRQVFLSPAQKEMDLYLDQSQRNIFVKPMVSEAPVQGKDEIKMPTIEKLLVDIYCDKDFFYLQGAEYDYIWENAFVLYNINTSTLLRYAARRGVKDELNKRLQ